MRKQAERIIAKMGGARRLAALLGLSPATVYRWRYPVERGGTGGLIPSEYHQPVLDLAAVHTVDLRPEDFFDRPRPARAGEPSSAAVSA